MGAAHLTLPKLGVSQASSFTLEDNNLEAVSLVWLDDLYNDTKEYVDANHRLRTSINHLKTFSDVRKCKNYIKSVPKDDRIVLIVNDRLGRQVVPRIYQLRQISSIYIYVTDSKKNDEWAKQFTKVKGATEQLHILVGQILLDQARRRRAVDEPLSINLLKSNSGEGQSTSELDGKFVHSQLSIDVLLRMKSTPADKNELINLCKEEYRDNETELAIVREFQQDYSADRALWWYTRESFLYRLLNKALRVQNTDMLYRFRFFIRDIEQQLEQHKCASPIRVYRGQLISSEELQILKDSMGQIISMNSFLSTSVDRQQALAFLDNFDADDNFQRVLFEIDADPRTKGVKPFANITKYSYFDNEQEVLMMLGSIFQLVSIRRDGRVSLVRMKLCSDHNNDLKPIFEHMKNQYAGNDGETDLLTFGTVLRNMGKFDDAEKYFRRLLNELPRDHDGIADCYHNLGEIAMEKGDYDLSLELHQKSLEIKMRTRKSNHPDVAESHNSIGIIHRVKGNNRLALESYNKALAIFKRAFGDNHPKVAKCFNNIGNTYQVEEKYTDALEYYRQALDIEKKCLPVDHPDLGSTHGNIGGAHQCLGHYDSALEHYSMSLKILEKSLPPQHPSIAVTLKNMGVMYENKGELRQALTYFEKAATIRRHAFPSTHPSVLLIEQDIQRVATQLRK